MKVVHVTQHLGIGGLEKIILHLAQEQKLLGLDVSVYVYDHDRSWVEYFRSFGFDVLTPPVKQEGYDTGLIRRMELDLFSFDVIHSHDIGPLMYLCPIYLKRRLMSRASPKFVHTAHTVSHHENFYRYRIYEKVASHFVDHFVGVSDSVTQFYRQLVGFDSRKLECIENGIAVYKGVIDQNLKQQKRNWLNERHGLQDGKFLILCLSRVVPLKNQIFLAQAVSLRPDLQLLIVGPSGNTDYFQALKNLEGENIKIAGAQELVYDYDLGCDLYVSASTHEGLPISVLEALFVEAICLVSDIPGHLSLNQDSKKVEIFKNNDAGDFIQKVESILSQKKDLLSKAQQVRVEVEAKYSAKSMSLKYLKLYGSTGGLS